MLLDYAVARQTLPREKRRHVEQWLPGKTPESQLQIDLFEVEDVPGANLKTRYCLLFKSSAEVAEFYDAWSNSTTRKAQIDQYIQIKNLLLVFLRMQVRVGILAKQCLDMPLKPLYILGFHQTFRQVQPFLNRSNAYFKLEWAKTRQPTPLRDSLPSDSQDLDHSVPRSRSRSREHRQKKNKFRDLSTDTMIQQLETCGEALIQQIHELENYFTGFYDLVSQTVHKLDQFH